MFIYEHGELLNAHKIGAVSPKEQELPFHYKAVRGS
jgi:hypothetical protein